MGRAPCCDKTDVKKGSWSSEEDAKLKDYIEKYGTGGNWIALPQKSGLKRCGKSCRLRWLNYLRPNIKHGGFSEEEDNIICSLYISIGSRWSIIAAQLPGRTDNDIKNYWNTRLKKEFLGGHKESQVNGNMRESKGIETLRNLAFERPQLHMQHQSLKNSNLHHYDNAPLWSCKLKPIKEKMMQKVEYYAQSNNPLQQECSPVSSLMINGMGNYMGINTPTSSSVISKSDVTKQPPSMELQWCWAFQAEIDDLMNNRPQLSTEFDCFKDMDGAKDSTSWWCNEFEANSNTWYSNGVLDHKQEVPRISERTYRV